MKKFIAVLLVFLMTISFCACESNSHAKIEVTDNEISKAILSNKIQNKINYEYLNFVFGESGLSEHYEKVILPEEESEVEKYLVENKIIVEECKSLDILFTLEDAQKTIQTQYDQVKQDASQKEYYNIILSTLAENSITETEYIELIKNEAYYKYNKRSLKKHFSTEAFDESKGTSLDEQFDEYLGKLVADY